MTIAAALHRSRATLSHWGFREYVVLIAFWLALSIPLLLAGWGWASVFSLPLLLATILALTYGVSALLKPAPRPKAQPRPGFPESLEALSGAFPLSTYSSERYEKTVGWCRADVRLSLSVESIESIDAVLRVAESICSTSAKVNAEVSRFAAARLLASINEERQVEGCLALTAEDLIQTISLQMITVHPDETYEFLFDDGGLLGGHWIEVHGDLHRGPIEIDTPG